MTDVTPPYVFLSACTAPQIGFRTIAGLADHIHALRGAAGGHGLKLIGSIVAGEAIPDGAAISVRVRDGREGGHGSLLGYAFLRWSEKAFTSPGRALLAAIEDAAQGEKGKVAA